MVAALALTLLLQLTPSQCVAELELPLVERVVAGVADFPGASARLASGADPMAGLTRLVRARAVRFCAAPPRLLVEWWTREDEPFARQAEFDALLDGVVAPLVAELTRADRELAALTGPALCERAMTSVAPALLKAAEPVDEARRAAWKKWKPAEVAKFYADACKAEQLFTTHREALQCYARIEGGLQHTLAAMESCDELEQPIDDWLPTVDERFELLLQKKR